MPSHNHHGFLVTSVTGSVSLKELPVPTYATIALASKAGKASGKPFQIVSAAKFYRTKFGQTVQNLSLKRGRINERTMGKLKGSRPTATEDRKNRAMTKLVANPDTGKIREVKTTSASSKLTNLLNQIKARNAERRFETKVKADTAKRHPNKELAAAKLMPSTLERESNARRALADQSYLSHAFVPSGQPEHKPLSDSDLFSLFSRQDTQTQHEIDTATKFRWDKNRVNKLVKSGSLRSLLILFRAGKLPAKARSYTKLRKLLPN